MVPHETAQIVSCRIVQTESISSLRGHDFGRRGIPSSIPGNGVERRSGPNVLPVFEVSECRFEPGLAEGNLRPPNEQETDDSENRQVKSGTDYSHSIVAGGFELMS
jgi:hypothetical protein